MTRIACLNCNDTGHVCENHPGSPWGHLCCDGPVLLAPLVGTCIHGACHCGGAGMPCRTCCDPIPEDGTAPIGAAFVPRHLQASS